MYQPLVSATARALAYNNAFVKEPQKSIISLDSFALSDIELPVPASARWRLSTQQLPVLPRETEYAAFCTTSRT
jgi:hypothetical protein